MSRKERIFHSLLFEVIALVLLTALATLVSDKPLTSLGGLAVTMSLIAMVWNYFFNIGFDKVYGTDRINRSFKLRVGHGLLFEAGMIILTLPVVMWVLEVTFLQALLLDIAGVVFFLIYAIVFNYAYDHIRVQIMGPTNQGSAVQGP